MINTNDCDNDICVLYTDHKTEHKLSSQIDNYSLDSMSQRTLLETRDVVMDC